MDRLCVHIGVCFLPWGGQVNTKSPLLGSKKQHNNKRDWANVIHGSVMWECGRWLSVSLPENRVSNKEPNAHCDEKSWWYIRRWWTAKVGVPLEFRAFMMGRRGNLGRCACVCVCVGSGHHEQSHNWEIGINSKSAAEQHLCSLRKYHSTLFTKNREGEEAFSVFSVSLFFLYIKYVLYEGSGGCSL